MVVAPLRVTQYEYILLALKLSKNNLGLTNNFFNKFLVPKTEYWNMKKIGFMHFKSHPNLAPSLSINREGIIVIFLSNCPIFPLKPSLIQNLFRQFGISTLVTPPLIGTKSKIPLFFGFEACPQQYCLQAFKTKTTLKSTMRRK